MRLIDADALGVERCSREILPAAYCAGWNGLVNMINDAPTIDAVPVVRCRHCQSHHWEQEPCHGKPVHYCKKLNAEVTADFFCAAGKRKDGDGDG